MVFGVRFGYEKIIYVFGAYYFLCFVLGFIKGGYEVNCQNVLSKLVLSRM